MTDSTSRWLSSLFPMVLIAGTAARFVYLSADPHYSGWIGYITDEGRWIENARSLHLYGDVAATGSVLHLMVAPLFQLVNFAVFEAFGLGRAVSRLFTALSGVALLFLFWTMFRRHVHEAALMAGLMVMAFQPDLLALSRLAVPEIPVLLCQCLVYFVVTSRRQSRWKPSLAAGLLTIGIAMKITMVFFVPVVLATYLAQAWWWRHERKSKLTELRRFSITLAAFALTASAVALYSLSEQALRQFDVNVHLIASFITWSSPYTIAAFFLDGELAASLGLGLLGAWLCCLAAPGAAEASPESMEFRHVIGAGTWLVSYLAMMLALDYFPLRYQTHILAPMTMLLIVGISAGYKLGLERVLAGVSALKAPADVIRSMLLAMPTAVFFAPLVVALLALAGADPQRMITRIAALTATVAAGTAVAGMRRSFRYPAVWIVFPFVAGIGYFALSTLTRAWSFWPRFGEPHTAQWAVFVGLCLAVSIFIGWKVERPGSPDALAWAGVAAVCYGLASVASFVPGYLPPHHTLQSASRDLATILPASGSVYVHRSDGLFAENDIRYFSNLNWQQEYPTVVVAFESYVNDKGLQVFLMENYSQLKRYELYAHPKYLWERERAFSPAPAPVVTVYRLNSP
jgi:hypothetical protein